MVSENCLAGCAANYSCGELMLPGPAGQQAESFAPWVWVKIGEGDSITVGNESYPSGDNKACIKSFEVGWIGMPTLQVEILDEAGGRMGAILDSIVKCPTNIGKGTTITYQFGWIINTCQKQKQVIPSEIFTATIEKLEINYTEGKIKYKIHANCVGPLVEIIRNNGTFGTAENKITIETAIRTLCAREPQINVRFMERQADGKWADTEFDWVGKGKGGVLNGNTGWQSDNSNRLAVIVKWLEPYRVNDGTAEGAGIATAWWPTETNMLVIFKDVFKSSFVCRGTEDGFNVGTFIVNGGKCSPVIEFSPTFDWASATSNFVAGGGTSGPGSSFNQNYVDAKKEGQDKECGAETGMQQTLTITQQAWDVYGPKNAWTETMRSQRAHNLAARITGDIQGMEADLKILGDPRPQFCRLAAGETASIVAINPFHLGGSGCGGWLAEPGCNPIMSNKRWQVKGFNHSIQSGSYTTTLKLTLALGVVDIPIGEPLGGVGSGGPVVTGG
jgi:hypothetical protein